MTDSNSVSASLATLGASGWAVNEIAGPGSAFRRGTTFCAIGESITGRYGLVQQAASTANVVGDGRTTVITLASSANFTGSKLSFVYGLGIPELDGQILTCTNIDVNTFSVPSALVGNPSVIPVWNNQMRKSERGWLTWALAYLKGKAWLLNNAAIGSSNVEWAAQTLTAQVLNYRPDYCFCLLGVNNILTDTPSALLTKCAAIYARLLANGIAPIVMTVLPLHQTFATFATAQPRIMQFNTLLKGYCEKNGLFLIDSFSAISDPAQADGRALAGAIQGTAGDFIHPSTYGARLVGKFVAAALDPFLPPTVAFTTTQADNVGANASNLNLWDNAPWSTTGGAASGTGVSGAANTPAGFNITSSGVVASTCVVSNSARTLVADGDIIGRNCDLTITYAEAAAIFTCTMSDVTSRLVAGKKYKYRMLLKLANTSGSNLIRVLMSMLTTYNGTNRGYISASEVDANPTVMPYEDGIYMLESPEFMVPAGQAVNSGFQPFIQFQSSAAGTAFIASLGRGTYVQIDP